MFSNVLDSKNCVKQNVQLQLMLLAITSNIRQVRYETHYVIRLVVLKRSGIQSRKYGVPDFRPVVLKVVDIDPQGSIGPSKGSINSHGVEWGSLNSQGVNK